MRRVRGERGFTLVEVLVSWSVLLVGIVGTLQVFAGAEKHTKNAQRRAAMMTVAERELERIRALPYAQIGLTGPPPAASSEAPRVGAAASEYLVDGGVVDPGATPFASETITGRIYRYVTWRAQSCPLLSADIGTKIDAGLSLTTAQAAIALGDLCPGAEDTKRITVAVIADEVGSPGKTLVPLRAQTVVSDHDASVLAGQNNPEGLKIDVSDLTDPATQTTTNAQQQLYSNATTQTFYLYDTRCSSSVRQDQAGSHPTYDTGQSGETCGGSNAPNLMGLAAPPDGAPVNDYSSDLLRSPVEGLALKQDSEAGSCAENATYAPSQAATRKWSVHRWHTKATSAAAEVLATGGRATLTLHTRTVGGASGSGRLCVVLRKAGTGTVLGTADFTLAQWPTETTQLAISFDVAGTTLAAGDRLSLIVRNHPDSEHDLELAYDRGEAPSALSITMVTGKVIA